ncbi:MAG: hypothetical protein WA958_18655 [Tunicatimonas sp.]
MKLLTIGILLLASLVACSEEDVVCEAETAGRYGEADLLLNGRPFTFAAIAGNSGCNDDNLTLNFVYYDETGLARMSLGIGNFPNQEGTYQLQKRNTGESECALDLTFTSFHTLEGDALGEAFHMVEEADENELVITHYDSASRRIEGRFSMTLAVVDFFRIDELNFPDTVRITYGTFSTEILPPEE